MTRTSTKRRPGCSSIALTDGEIAWLKLAGLMPKNLPRRTRRDRLVQRVVALEAELDASRNRAKRSQRELEMAKTEAEQRVTAARSSARAGREGEHQALEVAKREIVTLIEQLVSVTTDRDEAKARLKTDPPGTSERTAS